MLLRSIFALGLVVASAQMVQAAPASAPRIASASVSQVMARDNPSSNEVQVQPKAINVAFLTGASSIEMDGGEEEFHEHTPGWTGHTVVHGSNSTLAGSDEATEWQKTGFFR